MNRKHKITPGPFLINLKAGGYAKRASSDARLKRRQTGVSVKASEVEQPVVIQKRKPLLPGIAEALNAMSQLANELNKHNNIPPFTVSVDPIGEEWVLTLRGYDPGFDYYMGHTVRFMKSSLVKNPLAKNRR